MTHVVCRFAPSPTGRLHAGNTRIALVNWLLAKQSGGEMILRIDDTDAARSIEAHAQGIRDDLTWLGLAWDREEKQSARLARYDAAADKLRQAGRLYACYETAEELDAMRARLRRRGMPPIYTRAALGLTDEDRARLEAEGRRPHWRFKMDAAEITWDDLVRGPQRFEGAKTSDPVLVREDGGHLYMMSSAVDDIEMNITHVVRGEDHVTGTAVQIQIFEALGASPPAFAHLALLSGGEGEMLSKRGGSLSIEDLRAEGLEPMAVNALLARLGTSAAVEPAADLAALAADFDISRFGRAQARFDTAELQRLNTRILHAMDYADVRGRIGETVSEALWNAVRGNIETLSEAHAWAEIIEGESGGDVEGARESPAHFQVCIELLPPEPWDETTWAAWTGAVKQKTGVKGQTLFKPLRLALTGRGAGPEMAALLPLIGRARALKRLGG
ncbi:MAG: glutamate--tRNA ligase [Rhodospirillales bacterium]